MAAPAIELVLEDLASGEIEGITSAKGECHVEACLVMMELQGHTSGLAITSSGDVEHRSFKVNWSTPLTDQHKRTWADHQEALEEAAAGIAILTLITSTNYTILERACKGTGFDYWLGEKDDDILFQSKARFEVSGIATEGPNNTVAGRVQRKKKQVAVSNSMGLPAFVGIVEFGRPQTHLEKV